MAMFYDWRDRTGKEGIRPLREQLKELRSPLFIIMGVVLLILLAFSVAHHVQSNRESIEKEKVYLLPDPSEQRAVISETVDITAIAEVTSNDHFSLDATDTVQDDTTEVVSDAVPTAIEVETAWEIEEEDTTVIEPTIAELEAIDAETERLLVEGDMIAAKAMQTMGRAIPMIVNHLNVLSAADQREFLAEVRSQMVNAAPPEVQKLYAQNPELKDQGYNRLLEMLRENGWSEP